MRAVRRGDVCEKNYYRKLGMETLRFRRQPLGLLQAASHGTPALMYGQPCSGRPSGAYLWRWRFESRESVLRIVNIGNIRPLVHPYRSKRARIASVAFRRRTAGSSYRLFSSRLQARQGPFSGSRRHGEAACWPSHGTRGLMTAMTLLSWKLRRRGKISM